MPSDGAVIEVATQTAAEIVGSTGSTSLDDESPEDMGRKKNLPATSDGDPKLGGESEDNTKQSQSE